MIKKIIIGLILASTPLLFGFVYVDDIMFLGKKTCETNVQVEKIFEKGNEGVLKKYFCSESVMSANTITVCGSNVKEPFQGDTIVNLNESYLDIEYEDDYADVSYDKLLNYCESRTFDNLKENRLFGFFKPGKVICLDTKGKSLRVISFNTCANMSKLNKIINCLKADTKYNKAFAVRCGGMDLVKIK
ncbi:hypothetical protein RCC89_05060 [Cytophagaceae bacterium ABcell3]|nr:hypothetical protein RCC89_05060 [Cytophagaceae bacterium ABcell3]